ncbi:MAG: epimerase, partial [Myxococcales bacterium]|nr:epimerase [Myxococcales bacterium]
GVVGTDAATLAAESRSLELVLERVAAEPRLRERQGHFLLASSAGGVYGAAPECPITDDTTPVPISDYGRVKLAQEQLVARWARAQPRVATLAARFTNLYGPGQRLDKAQGLITKMAHSLIVGTPVHIYVSLDTIRDYLLADDAGQRMVSGLRRLAREAEAGAPSAQVTKVFASEREISIAGLIGAFRRMSRRRLRIVAGVHRFRSLQPSRLQFRSRVWTDESVIRTDLLEGISRVYRHLFDEFTRGRLPLAPG